MSSETPPDDVPGYVAKRIRTPPPSVCRVLPGSTPVVAFGDPRHSTVATLGLNPSKREFVMNDRNLTGQGGGSRHSNRSAWSALTTPQTKQSRVSGAAAAATSTGTRTSGSNNLRRCWLRQLLLLR